jgi:hypothetical protein
MNLKQFHRKFETVPPNERFEPIKQDAPPLSLFVIYERLKLIRKQLRYYEDQEEHLLKQAEMAFKQRENG